MKLYDRILREAKSSNKRDEDVLKCFAEAKVFDITSIVPLVGDWDEEKKHLIPKRPPYDIMWVEWDDKKVLGNGTIEGRCGVLLMKVTRNLMEVWAKQNFSLRSRAYYYEMILDGGWDEYYISQGFLDIKYGSTAVLNNGNIRVDCNVTFYCMRNNSTEAEAFVAAVPRDELEKQVEGGHRVLGFNLFGILSDTEMEVSAFVSAEVPLMACSLLHCRNVTTEVVHVDAKLQKATVKRGHPRLCDYHVIKLRLNEHRVVGISDEKGGREMRMHMVRGHFKNLQDTRYKERGWHWWPAHTRGNPELGTVEAGYELKK